MPVSSKTTVAFSEEVPSEDRVLNPLGIQYHLRFQSVFLPGITSVTKRIRYYTLQAWYYEHLYDDRVMTAKEFERLFIISCLDHHKGDAGHPALRRIHNRYRFDGDWDDHDEFELEFDISGFGRSYYIAQLETFRCAWSDALGQAHRTRLNERLAGAIDVPPELFEPDIFRKDDLPDFAPLCPCGDNPTEREILSKLFFGFFTKTDDGWDIDDTAYEQFLDGTLELEFDEDFDAEDISQAERTKQENLRRRNTLFLFLKIISETEPADVRRAIWDGLYFGQNRDSHAEIVFGELERAREYWEFYQLTVYYVFAVESLLDVLQQLIRESQGLEQERLLERLTQPEIHDHIEDIVDDHCETIGDILNGIKTANGTSRSTLNCPINESDLYDRIDTSSGWREKAAASVVLLHALALRYEHTPEAIRTKVGRDTETAEFSEPLDIHTFFERIDGNRQMTVEEWLQEVIQQVKRRHLTEAANRFHGNGTRCWLFTEEQSRLYFARQEPISIDPRDNRWGSVQSLLMDLDLVTEAGDELVTTERGEQWLQKIE